MTLHPLLYPRSFPARGHVYRGLLQDSGLAMIRRIPFDAPPLSVLRKVTARIVGVFVTSFSNSCLTNLHLTLDAKQRRQLQWKDRFDWQVSIFFARHYRPLLGHDGHSPRRPCGWTIVNICYDERIVEGSASGNQESSPICCSMPTIFPVQIPRSQCPREQQDG